MRRLRRGSASKAGDVIVEIGDEKITTSPALRRPDAGASGSGSMAVRRGDKVMRPPGAGLDASCSLLARRDRLQRLHPAANPNIRP